ncbi:MAG: hypothetical protein J2P45_16090 [Candidatus Dormibacteraeota bacterium]|nr:hypothetical protein [Candidatus Dormibacteraeota bacterium]
MRVHRAIVLALMILFGVLLVGTMTFYGIATFTSSSLVALVVVVAAAALGGIAFSWRRYFGRR